jgi:hypothetical protein
MGGAQELFMTRVAYMALLSDEDGIMEPLDGILEEGHDVSLDDYKDLRKLGYRTFEDWLAEDEFLDKSPLFNRNKSVYRSNSAPQVNVTYDERKQLGEIGEIKVLEYLASRKDTIALRDVSDDPDYFQGDVDIRWWTRMEGNLFTKKVDYRSSKINHLSRMKRILPWGREVKVEVKTTTKSLLRKDSYFVFQTVSNLETGLPGWAYRTDAERLVVWNLSTRIAYAFNMPPLKDYLRDLEKDQKGDGFLTVDIPQRDGNRVVARNRCLLVSKTLIDQLDPEEFDHVQFKLE